MKKRTLFLSCLLTLLWVSGCGKVPELPVGNKSDSSSAPSSETAVTPSENEEQASEGFINLPDDVEFAELLSDTEGTSVLARMYHADAVSVLSIEGNWARITFSNMTGYVQLQYISFSAPSAKETSAPPTEAPTEAETKLATQKVTVPNEEQPDQKQPDKTSERNDIIDSYAYMIRYKYDKAFNSGAGYANVTFALYDMDYDGIPELMIKSGTCEADYEIAFYSYKNGAVQYIDEGLHGGHTSFGYDYVANQVVLCEGHMGYGIMYWYDLNNSGNLRFLIDTGTFEYGGNGLPEYSDVMYKYNVSYLDYCYMDGDSTYSYYFSSGDSSEYTGFNFQFLQDHIY